MLFPIYRAWEKRLGNPVHWIEGAGHNSNCDKPDAVNALIEQYVLTHYDDN